MSAETQPWLNSYEKPYSTLMLKFMVDIRQENFLDRKKYITGRRWWKLKNIAQCRLKNNCSWDMISSDVSQHISVGCIWRPMSPMVFLLNPWIIYRLGTIRLTPTCDSCWETWIGHLPLQEFFRSMSVRHIFSPRFASVFSVNSIRADQCQPKHKLGGVPTKNLTRPRCYYLWVTSDNRTFSTIKNIFSAGIGKN